MCVYVFITHVDTRRRECSNGASGIIIIFLLFTKSLRLLAVVGIVTYSIEREVRNVLLYWRRNVRSSSLPSPLKQKATGKNSESYFPSSSHTEHRGLYRSMNFFSISSFFFPPSSSCFFYFFWSSMQRHKNTFDFTRPVFCIVFPFFFLDFFRSPLSSSSTSSAWSRQHFQFHR